MAMTDARDARIEELESQVDTLKENLRSQRNTIDALQKTNQLLTEQLEEKCKQIQSSHEQFATSHGLGSSGNLQDSLSIDQMTRKDSTVSNDESQTGATQPNAQSIKSIVDDDDIYDSGGDIETYKTKISDDHELLPLKQGTLKKKSESIHRYNSRYVVLYPSFLLYYDQCPIKTGRRRKNSSVSFTSKNDANNDINHPKGTIFLRNYHVSIRKDETKKRFDITFVPHESAVSMGLAAIDARIRFRCKSLHELLEWTEKIRTAITSSNSGFIKYDVRTDYINNSTNFGQASDNKEDSKDGSEDGTKMFDKNDLMEMMRKQSELQSEIEVTKRSIATLEQEREALQTELQIKATQIESEQRVIQKKERDMQAKMEDIFAHETTLKNEIEKLHSKQKDQHRKLKRYKYHELDIQKNIGAIQKWSKKLEENSLQYLGSLYPNCSGKQLFETCQKGCVAVLEEIYEIKNKERRDSLVSDASADEGIGEECKSNEKVHSKRKRESKMSQEMMSCFSELFRKHIKTTINYASLQQAHNGVKEDFRLLKQDFEAGDFDGNTLQDEALIMASITASLF